MTHNVSFPGEFFASSDKELTIWLSWWKHRQLIQWSTLSVCKVTTNRITRCTLPQQLKPPAQWRFELENQLSLILQPKLEKRMVGTNVFIGLPRDGLHLVSNSHCPPFPSQGQGQTPAASLPHAAWHFASVAPHSEVVARHPESRAIGTRRLKKITYCWLHSLPSYPNPGCIKKRGKS